MHQSAGRWRHILEGVHIACLVLAGQALFVISSVLADVLHVGLGKLANGFLDGLHATLLTHRLSGVVRVRASTIPVTLDRLGSKCASNVVLLTQAVQEVAGKHDLHVARTRSH